MGAINTISARDTAMNVSFTLTYSDTNIIHRPNYFVIREITFINGSCHILYSMSLISVIVLSQK